MNTLHEGQATDRGGRDLYMLFFIGLVFVFTNTIITRRREEEEEEEEGGGGADKIR